MAIWTQHRVHSDLKSPSKGFLVKNFLAIKSAISILTWVSCVVFPDPVSPTTTTTWLSLTMFSSWVKQAESFYMITRKLLGHKLTAAAPKKKSPLNLPCSFGYSDEFRKNLSLFLFSCFFSTCISQLEFFDEIVQIKLLCLKIQTTENHKNLVHEICPFQNVKLSCRENSLLYCIKFGI